MSLQPSANGIAALFQGNPGALQQRVQKEQQGKPGLPPDLKELMALQILTEKTDAAQRQQAMNQLNQAGGPNMPTVAQTLQERAKQALQARMVQAQQQQQAQQPQPQPIQTPRPPDQPEATPEMMQQLAAMQAQGTAGLDQLPSNVGENYAGGGIIAFAGKTDGSLVKAEDDDEEDTEKLIRRLKRERFERPDYMPEGEAPLRNQGITGGTEGIREGGQGLSENIPYARSRGMAEEPYVPSKPGITALQSQQERFGPEVPATPPSPQYNIPTREQLRAMPPAKAPAAPAPQAPAGILTPAQEQQITQIMLDRANANPEERRTAKVQRAESMMGAPTEQMAGLQLLIDELAKRRETIARKQQEAGGFDEFMRQIAIGPRAGTSAAAGAYGVEGVRRRQEGLEAQDLETMMKLAETKVKLADVKRGWDEKKFTIGEAEFDSVFKDKYDAAKALGLRDAEAKKLAQEAILKREEMERQLQSAKIYTGPQWANIARTDQAIAAYKKANPKATDYEAMMAAQHPNAFLAPDKQLLAELTKLAENLKVMMDPMKTPDLDPEKRKEAARQFDLITAKMAQMAGVDIGSASTPPPGAVRLKK